MLSRLRLINYQSHRDTHLELGKFTVIVGASSSGKTSLIRALKLLVFNARGTSYVRHGASSARVQGVFAQFDGDPLDAQIQVAVERGPGTSVYELTIPGEDLIKFTKCGTSVPDIIKAANDLGEDDLWVAGQFDRPFLLDETGSKVAKVMGDLTNVSMIFAAVRECNRRALDYKRKHTECSAYLSQVRLDLQSYLSLPKRLSACSAAESALYRANSLNQRYKQLLSLCREIESSFARASASRVLFRQIPDIESLISVETRRSRLAEMVRTVEAAARRRVALPSVSVPDLRRLEALSARRSGLRTVLLEVESSESSRRKSFELLELSRLAVEDARIRFLNLMTESGVCPTCGALSEHARYDCVS